MNAKFIFGLLAFLTLLNEFNSKVGAIGKDDGCSWVGSAPFCDPFGRGCPSGFHATKLDPCGDGECCWTGIKKYCCPNK